MFLKSLNCLVSFINDYKLVYKYHFTHLWNIVISRVEVGSNSSQQHNNILLQHNSGSTLKARTKQLELITSPVAPTLLLSFPPKPSWSQNSLDLLSGKIRSYDLMFVSQNKKIAYFCPREENKQQQQKWNRSQNYIIKVKSFPIRTCFFSFLIVY